ncbi:MAG: hypothetical protein K2K86_07185 [Muribaculaceae bacterium]|nr:hypothetical protein [Muribaculaceae bacterium]
MMKKFKLIGLLLPALMLSSCLGYYSKVSHLSDEELEWVNCYNVGDTVLFESDSGMVDTLVVDYKNIENSRWPFYIHFIDNMKGDYYNATAIYTFDIKGLQTNIEGSFRVTKLSENDSIEWKSYLMRRFSNGWPYKLGRGAKSVYDKENPIKVTDYIYNGKKLSNCIVFDDDNSTTSKYNDYPDSIESYVISKEYGLLTYKFAGGDTYTRK